MNCDAVIEISSNDYWFKVVDMLQVNWALIEKNVHGAATIYFIHEDSGIFDTISYSLVELAQDGLKRNGFTRYIDDIEAQGFFIPPSPPFRHATYTNGNIYSSGRFWKKLPQAYSYPDNDPFFAMCGAVIGDIAGSTYEGKYIKELPEELIEKRSRFTDDTILTCAVAEGLLQGLSLVERSQLSSSSQMQGIVTQKIALTIKKYARLYPHGGYGSAFKSWVHSDLLEPYNSYGNGSAMRVSFAGWYANSLEEAMLLGRLTAQTTHNHPLGIKGAEVVAACIYILKTGGGKKDILQFATQYYNLDFTLDALRPIHSFNVTCDGTVPTAIVIFLESNCFVNLIKLAISMGGDVDTIAAIAGSIGEAYYSVPENLQLKAIAKLDAHLLDSFRASTVKLIEANQWKRNSVVMDAPLKRKWTW